MLAGRARSERKINSRRWVCCLRVFAEEVLETTPPRRTSGFEGEPTTVTGPVGSGFGFVVRGARRHRAADNFRELRAARLCRG